MTALCQVFCYGDKKTPLHARMRITMAIPIVMLNIFDFVTRRTFAS